MAQTMKYQYTARILNIGHGGLCSVGVGVGIGIAIEFMTGAVLPSREIRLSSREDAKVLPAFAHRAASVFHSRRPGSTPIAIPTPTPRQNPFSVQYNTPLFCSIDEVWIGETWRSCRELTDCVEQQRAPVWELPPAELREAILRRRSSAPSTTARLTNFSPATT